MRLVLYYAYLRSSFFTWTLVNCMFSFSRTFSFVYNSVHFKNEVVVGNSKKLVIRQIHYNNPLCFFFSFFFSILTKSLLKLNQPNRVMEVMRIATNLANVHGLYLPRDYSWFMTPFLWVPLRLWTSRSNGMVHGEKGA